MRSSMHSSAAASIIGPENAVKSSGSWAKMAYRVTLSLYIIDIYTHSIFRMRLKKSFEERVCQCRRTRQVFIWVQIYQMLLITEICGESVSFVAVYLAPLPE